MQNLEIMQLRQLYTEPNIQKSKLIALSLIKWHINVLFATWFDQI